MNKAVTKRIISKQEASCLVADLPLTVSTEIIENVSISNSKMLAASDEGKSSSSAKTFINEYKQRPLEFETESLHSYFHIVKNANRLDTAKKLIIPNFVGVNGTPKYPVTDDYARHTLIVHQPWRNYPTDINWREEFATFMESGAAPTSAQMAYLRVMRRFVDKMEHYEAKAQDGDHAHNDVNDEDAELLLLVGLKGGGDDYDEETALFRQMDRGLSFQWDKPAKVSSDSGTFCS